MLRLHSLLASLGVGEGALRLRLLGAVVLVNLVKAGVGLLSKPKSNPS